LWLGDHSVAGKTILLHSEQGLGDTIFFARYVPLLQQMGAQVLLEVQPSLKDLLTQLAPAGTFTREEAAPGFDLHIPVASLPLAFGTLVDTIPADIPYLEAPPARVAQWRNRLPQGRRLIGLAWAGHAGHRSDQHRSIPLATFAPLLAAQGVQWVSLQTDIRPHDAETLRDHPGILRAADDFRDFSDTAAVISLLDGVVSVDTAVAHLAGAMGKPVSVLLPFAPDFRWLLGREDSPWYPTAKLLRQPRPGDWDAVVGRLVQSLAA
jgi:ADP-heptose:LPS heptosyltransferase